MEGGGGGDIKTLPKKPKMIAHAKNAPKKNKTHLPVCNSKAIIARIVLIYLKVRGGQVVF